ncbi:MAG: GNAT family N-acetyltransferase [Tepidiformaceae bacterium]
MTQLSPLALMELQVRTLYELDAFGRIIRMNTGAEPPVPRAAPRFFLGRTHAGNVVLLHQDLPKHVAAELRTIAAAEPLAYDFEAPPRQLYPLLHALRRHASAQDIWRGPAFTFPEELSAPSANVAELTREDTHRLHPELAEWAVDFPDCEPAFSAFEDGVAVAICASARLGRGGAEAGVETASGFRGKGYAGAATTAWAQAIRDSGRVPFYSTSWENSASRAVARKLGLTLFGEDIHVS